MPERMRWLKREEPAAERDVERLRYAVPYWPAQVAVLAAIGLQLLMPAKVTPGPRLLVPGLEAILLVGLAITTPHRNRAEFRRRRRFAIGLIALVSAANALSLALLVEALLEGAKTSGRDLLLGALMIWLTNIIIFALWYWEMDGGGPMEREDREDHRPRDFLFPQMADPEPLGPDWRPRFPDYLYLAFTNASAFSPTDAMPLSVMAKMLMLVQALISLLTVLLVAARAVNILA